MRRYSVCGPGQAKGAAPWDNQVVILYEDNHLLVVEKPFNLPSQADSSGQMDLLALLKEDIARRYHKPGAVYLGLVQRLDRPTGGLMVLARTTKAASRLSSQLRQGLLHKQYLAIVHGCPPGGQLEHCLLKDPQSHSSAVVDPVTPGAKTAVLLHQTLACHKGLSLITVILQTGRSHQIRVQLSAVGSPLYGDQRYGATVNQPGRQLALWSAKLSFEHPVRKEPMAFFSMPPACAPWNDFHTPMNDWMNR